MKMKEREKSFKVNEANLLFTLPWLDHFISLLTKTYFDVKLISMVQISKGQALWPSLSRPQSLIGYTSHKDIILATSPHKR